MTLLCRKLQRFEYFEIVELLQARSLNLLLIFDIQYHNKLYQISLNKFENETLWSKREANIPAHL
jgi:hypothetical protein